MQQDPSLERYRILASRWMDGSITPAEEIEFSVWYNQAQDVPVVVPGAFAESEEAHQARLLDKINRTIESQVPVKRSFFHLSRFTAAAAVLIVLAAGLYFYLPGWRQATNQHHLKAGDFAPGSTKAILILSNGTKIDLQKGANGIIARQGNTSIKKTAAGQLVYHAPPSGTAGQETPEYNLIQIPRGGEYQLVLPDGSRIWLNAASSLRYPAKFSGKERIVELTGEAYFEVAKNAAMPFKVQTKGMLVEVLGTHFNMEAYPEEAIAKTTLLEGSVKVWNTKQGRQQHSEILKPGEQAVLKNGLLDVQNVDTDAAVAWKNGLTYFDQADIKSIMRQVSRWYNVEVEFKGDLSGRTFTGKIPRSANLSKVLKVLELSDIHFKMAGETIVVTP